MERDELGLYRDNLLWMLGRAVGAARDAGPRARTRPAARDANSPVEIASHVLGAAQEHVLGWALGRRQPVDGDAFADVELEDVVARAQAVELALVAGFSALEGIDPDRLVETPGRGPQPVRSVLQWAILHAAEHAGAAELTRDLLGEP